MHTTNRHARSVNCQRLKIELLEDRRLLSATTSRRILTTPLDTQDPSYASLDAARGTLLTEAEVFNLQSKPGSNFTVLLDFDGHVTTGTDWNFFYEIDTIVSPAFDLDSDPTGFSQFELQRMLLSWQRTAEDFAPFDVNVTTRDPGVAALINSGSGDSQWGIRAIATVDNFADCGCGGFAFLNSFGDPFGAPTFIFNSTEGSLGETFSHEVGHTLGLVHDGLNLGGQEYYGGHGTGATGWGPIMGAPFSKNITHWDKGEYFDSSNTTEDDLEVITTINGFGYRADDHGNTRPTASILSVAAGTNLSAFGIMERNTDIDFFRFQTGTGNVSLSVSTLATRPNVDLWAGIYSSAGALLAQSNPSGQQAAEFQNLALSAGTYFLRVEGIGSNDIYSALNDSLIPPATPPWSIANPTGYSNYGSLGQYAISGTVVSPGANTFSLVATDAAKAEGSSGLQTLTFTVTRGGNLSATSSVNYSFASTLPTSVGQSYPSLATASDFVGGTVFNGLLSFAANEVSKVITLQVLGDTEFEQDEFFDLVLTGPSAGWTLANSRATGTILGDENVFGFPAIQGTRSALEGPFQGTLIRWRQVGAGAGPFDEWGLNNVSINATTPPFADDFDPDIDLSNWSTISTGFASNRFTGSSGKALVVTGDSDRRIVSRPLTLEAGDVLSFSIIFGDSMNGGENADPGEDVFLEYSVNGGNTWTELAVYDTEDFTTWTPQTVTFPTGIGTNPAAEVLYAIDRDGGTTLPATVNWAVELNVPQDTAKLNDFPGGVLPSGQIQFDVGESRKFIAVPIQGDPNVEANETFSIRLTSVSGTGTVSLHAALSTSTGQIDNDDVQYLLNPGPKFRWRQLSHTEGAFDEWAIDNVSLSGTSFADDFDPSIDESQWSSLLLTDVNNRFGGTGNSLFFTGGNTQRSASSFRISANPNAVLSFDLIYGNDANGGERPDPGEEVVLEYSVNNGTSWVPIRTYPLSITSWATQSEILPAGATQVTNSRPEGNAGSTAFSFTIEREGAVSGSTTIPWSVVAGGVNPASGSDFVGGTFPTGMVTFADGESTKTVNVEVRGDVFSEPDETFEFVIAAPSGDTSVVATILNDDTLIAGDFNSDGLFDCTDVDQLVANIVANTGNLTYDLNQDGMLTTADLTQWLAIAGAANLPSGMPYLPGDATLDGAVDGSDFSVWNGRKFTAGTGWCGGDFNADGFADGSDFSIWNTNKFTSADAVRIANGAVTPPRDLGKGPVFPTRPDSRTNHLLAPLQLNLGDPPLVKQVTSTALAYSSSIPRALASTLAVDHAFADADRDAGATNLPSTRWRTRFVPRVRSS